MQDLTKSSYIRRPATSKKPPGYRVWRPRPNGLGFHRSGSHRCAILLYEWDLFNGSILTDADFSGAVVTGACFPCMALAAGVGSRRRTGLTKEQLYSTASYQKRNLQGIDLAGNDLTGCDFSGQDLTNANLSGATLKHANLAGQP